jgi:hypothetical protein
MLALRQFCGLHASSQNDKPAMAEVPHEVQLCGHLKRLCVITIVALFC